MRYLSPASLPESPPLSPPDKKAWTLLRKKLLADLELSADGTLYIKGRSFTRNDILEFFEGLQDDTILNYHAAVAEDRVLLEFLEDSQFPAEGCFAEAPIYDDGHFLHWISPWFHTAFVACVTDCLERANEDELRALVNSRFLLTDYDRQHAWMQIGQLLENDASKLDQFYDRVVNSQPGDPFAIEDLLPYTDESLIRMILLLPEGPFTTVRNRYAAILMDLTIQVYNKHKEHREVVAKWLYHVKRLAVSSDLIATVDARIAELDKMRNKSGGTMVRAAIVILIVISQVFTNRSSPDLPKVTKLTFINGKDTVVIDESNPRDSALNRKKMDSIIKAAPKSY